MKYLKYIREINELAAKYGFGEAQVTPGHHLVVQHLTNRRKVFTAKNPSDNRSIKNFEATLRQVSRLPALKPGEPDETR